MIHRLPAHRTIPHLQTPSSSLVAASDCLDVPSSSNHNTTKTRWLRWWESCTAKCGIIESAISTPGSHVPAYPNDKNHRKARTPSGKATSVSFRLVNPKQVSQTTPNSWIGGLVKAHHAGKFLVREARCVVKIAENCLSIGLSLGLDDLIVFLCHVSVCSLSTGMSAASDGRRASTT